MNITTGMQRAHERLRALQAWQRTFYQNASTLPMTRQVKRQAARKWK